MSPEAKDLVKAKALKAAEDHIILGLNEAIEIGEIMVTDTSNPFDNGALSVLKMFKGQLKDFIDNIDGIDNQD